ncbi:protein of unknown function [Burkholderia multivorans]
MSALRAATGKGEGDNQCAREGERGATIRWAGLRAVGRVRRLTATPIFSSYARRLAQVQRIFCETPPRSIEPGVEPMHFLPWGPQQYAPALRAVRRAVASSGADLGSGH